MLWRQRGFVALSWLFCLAGLATAQSEPTHDISSFKYLPARLFLFDDTEVAVYHDSEDRNVYLSFNEGKKWELADGIPKGEALMFVEHPTNNRHAFVLTDGTTHYRTTDRGRTWQSFDLPVSLASVARPLSFHSDPKSSGYVLYQGTRCERQGWAEICRDETYYTKDSFSTDAKLMMKETSRCQFAHSRKDFKHDAHNDLIYCVAFDTSSSHMGGHSLSSSKLFSSTDFFDKERHVVDLGIAKNAKGIIAFAIVSKFAVVAMKDVTHPHGEMMLYVSLDAKTWAKAHFPHASSAKLRENAYTMLESTTHSLAVDVVLKEGSSIGTLFVSNSNGTYFTESLKDTNRNEHGYVDYERLYGVEGIGLVNIVANAQDVDSRRAKKHLRTLLTFDDGRTWSAIKAPDDDVDGKRISCDPSDLEKCSLHFHSVTAPHNFGRVFSSPAPGFVMGVGSIGDSLEKYKDSDTFLSTDAGVTWRMVAKGAHKYEFGDSGSILIAVDDEDPTDEIKYSLDLGRNWKTYNFGVKLRARALTTLPDSTSQKFILLGSVHKHDQKGKYGNAVTVFLDFAKTRGKKCSESDYEKWYARPPRAECIMGHKQWYKRRKPEANCFVGEKFTDPVVHEDACECTDADYECDYNFIRNGNKCVPAGPEPIPDGVCSRPDMTYDGSSGYRKIPGNTCKGGLEKDEKVRKKCSQAQPQEGNIIHQTHNFKAQILQHAYFAESKTILVLLNDHSIWQSSNEGYTWNEPMPGQKFIFFMHHKYTKDRAYLLTDSVDYYYTTDTGRTWIPSKGPTPPSQLGAQVLHFHPNSDYLIWAGDSDCENNGPNCKSVASYSTDNGRRWAEIESYTRNCAFAVDHKLDADPTEIICESYVEKKGNQASFGMRRVPMELIVGGNFYQNRRKLFDSIAGFAKFSEYLVVAEVLPHKDTMELQVSLDGQNFATGKFPPSLKPDSHGYTVLESSTKSLFIHMTTTEPGKAPWGVIMKSNSNGTYFGLSVDNVNRNENGYIDFEKMIGLDGIALINVVSNTREATVSGRKKLQSRITHNDGGTWAELNPPKVDSNGDSYECKSTKCALHVHGYTERRDPRATYSSPGIVGLLMAVGNVGESLANYKESDTFLSRDGGFTWTEIHKDAHQWEFGDSGSILIMANDEEPTTHVLYSTNEGLDWHEYKFSDDPMRVWSIVTVSSDTSRRFILFGEYPRRSESIAVHIDFSALTSRKCEINIEDPGKDDFELWSPSEEREEMCLFGRRTLYHRRVRDSDCVVGEREKAADKIVENCQCTKADFECEFNYVRNTLGDCELVPGTEPLAADVHDQCKNGEEFWYERTAYRVIPYSSCEDGYRQDRGNEHRCPGLGHRSVLFWLFMLFIPFGFTALVAYYYYRRSGLARGNIRLSGDSYSPFGRGGNGGVLDTLASVPWFLIGLAGIAYESVAAWLDTNVLRSRRGYRNVPIDEDAQILRFEDEE
ncbi:signal sequence binding protein [Panaeolus papilionaceus]|nr:signal sequence binding protein [Panaeolus papilionaceus]